MEQSSIWEKLKEFSTIAAGIGILLYVLGYTIHVVHYYHILGIDIPIQPLEYIRTGGDFCASVLISILQLFTNVNYFSSLFRYSALIIATVLIVLVYIGLLLPFRSQRNKAKFGGHKWPYVLIGIFLVTSLSLLMWQEYKLLTVKNVLQTFDLEKVKEAQENIGGNSREQLNIRLNRIDVIYSDYVDNGGDHTEGFERWKDWYSLKALKSPKQSRLSFYLALLFLNTILIIALWLYGWTLRKAVQNDWQKPLTYISITISILLLIFFSFAYAVLGKSYDYPVITLRLDSKDANESSGSSTENQVAKTAGDKAERVTHPVYLVARTDVEIIVYDRLDFLKVKYIPRSRVLGIDQLFVASPFEHCSKKSEIPCEASEERDDLWIEDF